MSCCQPNKPGLYRGLTLEQWSTVCRWAEDDLNAVGVQNDSVLMRYAEPCRLTRRERQDRYAAIVNCATAHLIAKFGGWP